MLYSSIAACTGGLTPCKNRCTASITLLRKHSDQDCACNFPVMSVQFAMADVQQETTGSKFGSTLESQPRVDMQLTPTWHGSLCSKHTVSRCTVSMVCSLHMRNVSVDKAAWHAATDATHSEWCGLERQQVPGMQCQCSHFKTPFQSLHLHQRRSLAGSIKRSVGL